MMESCWKPGDGWPLPESNLMRRNLMEPEQSDSNLNPVEAKLPLTFTIITAFQANIGGCRHELGAPTFDKCWEPAEYVLWGKLFPAEALGPRCYKHAEPYGAAHFNEGWAVINLKQLALDMTAVVQDLLDAGVIP
jgi:hypothetical protein